LIIDPIQCLGNSMLGEAKSFRASAAPALRNHEKACGASPAMIPQHV
jgi:hypothetical protein